MRDGGRYQPGHLALCEYRGDWAEFFWLDVLRGPLLKTNGRKCIEVAPMEVEPKVCQRIRVKGLVLVATMLLLLLHTC